VELASPTNANCSGIKKLATGIALEDGDLFQQFGQWVMSKKTHQTTKWNLDARSMSLYRYHGCIWTKYRAVNYGRLRFKLTGVETTEPSHITHKAECTSEIGECFHALSKHVHQQVGKIPDITFPATFNCTEPADLIVATEGSLLFGVGYHSLLISTKNEHILLRGGGPDDGSPLYITSYRSELGGICAGLAVIGIFARFG
jgi:hypothetical protein